MTGWYESWREVKRRLEEKPEDEFLQNLLGNLREMAVHDYVERYAGLDIYEEPIRFKSEDVSGFLLGLDEIRGTPKSSEVEALRKDMARSADEVLDKLSKLPWSGDNTYGEAIDDARELLWSVLRGKAVEVRPERFRCPSEYASPDAEGNLSVVVRCDLQLPHSIRHTHRLHPTEESGYISWTDAESVNSPQPESGEVQAETHIDMAGGLSERHHWTSSPCAETPVSGPPGVCVRPVGHAGTHRRSNGTEWLG